MGRILLVDDEPDIRQLIRIHLEQAGLRIIEADSGNQAIQRMQEHPVELIILDLMMEDGDGFDVLHYLRETNSKSLVIALSAKREDRDKITTLGLGADDYVTKPFSPMELLARVQAHLRRHRTESPFSSEVIRLNKLVLYVDHMVLQHYDKQQLLTPIECQLLQLFMRNPDRVLTKREIYKTIWNHENYDENNLSVFISRLRRILENTAGSPLHLQTIRSVGYRFSGDGL